MAALPRFLAAALLLAPAGCSDRQDGPVVVSVIGSGEDIAHPLTHVLSPPSKLILEATAQGLVAFDAQGDILPALAQRWIVEDDGKSYIFRLRRARWPNGERIDANDVARLLRARIAANLALDRHGDLAAIAQVVPMTGEVIEIRLSVARPYLLQMLAQPQMAVLRSDGGTGPYRKEARPGGLLLTPVVPSDEDGPIPDYDYRILRAERAAKAVARFRAGLSALVLGGRLSDLPLLNRAEIEKQAVHIDPVQGLFGLAVTGTGPFLNDPAVRAAINMSIARERLPAAFGLGGWAYTDRLIPQQLDLPRAPLTPDWDGQSITDRQAAGAAAIARWRAGHGAPPVLRIAMPEGSGSRLLFAMIAADLRQIGVPARLVGMEADADLRLIDEVAAYDSAIWYLGRVSCTRNVQCDPAAERKLDEAERSATALEVQARLAEAEAITLAHNGYIPLGNPVRWSLAARYLNGFASSSRARHPLNYLFRSTN